MYKVKIAGQVNKSFSKLKQALQYADECNEKFGRNYAVVVW
ncbi:hypothetical protein PB1E_0740 [Leuconostoc gelidum subsp. gasicomitatum]|nr:hypothetical protein PB1E_0740 [Leuconostoc gasicomitatum]